MIVIVLLALICTLAKADFLYKDFNETDAIHVSTYAHVKTWYARLTPVVYPTVQWRRCNHELLERHAELIW